MQTVAQFAARMTRAPVVMRAAEREMVTTAALTVTTSVRREIASATRGSNRLSGVGLRGAKVGVGFDIKGTARPTALVAARGPLHLVERDTKPHPINRRKRRGKRALAGDGFGPVARVANHPGTRGKHPFERGVTSALPVATREAQGVLGRAVYTIVRG